MTNVLESMATAVAAAPSHVGLRVQYARLLLEHGSPAEALEQASTALQLDPASADALALVGAAATALTGPSAAPGAPTRDTTTDGTAAGDPATPRGEDPAEPDWARLESELGVDVPPPFVDGGPELSAPVPTDGAPTGGGGWWDVSREVVTLADVGGLETVKQRLHESFLAPMRNAEIARAFGKSLRGGLLLYGPPGTGKTYLARAVAGELGARFLTVTLADILDRWIGASERNLHDLFAEARRLSPAVLFLDEIDAIGGKRGAASPGMRTVVNQLLQELDGVGSDNDGLFVLGATNHPWDVDTALLRPGRFDRVVLVVPPDPEARAAILHRHLAGRPVAGIDIDRLVKRTDGFSGADLAHLCTTAAEKAMTASIQGGVVRPIGMGDFKAALAEVRPTTAAWLQSAKNVVAFANRDGIYDDLAVYLKQRKLL